MNGEVFCEYFEKSILPNMPDRGVIVLDNARYHTVFAVETRHPRPTQKRSEILNWMRDHKVKIYENADFTGPFIDLPPDEKLKRNYTKSFLIKCSKIHCHSNGLKERLRVDLLLEAENKKKEGRDLKILWLPVQHCELNPIEMIWANVKHKIKKMNLDFKKSSLDMVPWIIWPDDPLSVRQVQEFHAKKLKRAQKAHTTEYKDQIKENKKLERDYMKEFKKIQKQGQPPPTEPEYVDIPPLQHEPVTIAQNPVNDDLWEKCVKHVIKVEDDYVDADLVELSPPSEESFIIQVSRSSDEEGSGSEHDMSE